MDISRNQQMNQLSMIASCEHAPAGGRGVESARLRCRPPSARAGQLSPGAHGDHSKYVAQLDDDAGRYCHASLGQSFDPADQFERLQQMMIDAGRYTSGRIAIANLSASIDSLERRRVEAATFEDLLALSKLLFLRGDLLGRIADHDRAELIATGASAMSPDAGSAFYIRSRLAERFHRFDEANALLDQAVAYGYPAEEVDPERAALLHATGRYDEARVLRERLAQESPGIHTLGALGSLLAESGQWAAAEMTYEAAIDADEGTSPIPCGQLLFEWGVSAMRRGDLDRAETIFTELDAILPQHVPGRGHRAEVALARGQLDVAAALITPLLEIADDPEYRAIYAEILAANGDAKGTSEAERAAAGYERLLERRPEAYADHAAAFYMGIGNRPQRAVELSRANRKLRDTPRARGLLAKALKRAAEFNMGRLLADQERVLA